MANAAQQMYLDSVGNPKKGSVITAPAPAPGLFPPYKGAKGPKQKECLASGGIWDGPTGKKFCIMPLPSQVEPYRPTPAGPVYVPVTGGGETGYAPITPESIPPVEQDPTPQPTTPNTSYDQALLEQAAVSQLATEQAIAGGVVLPTATVSKKDNTAMWLLAGAGALALYLVYKRGTFKRRRS